MVAKVGDVVLGGNRGVGAVESGTLWKWSGGGGWAWKEKSRLFDEGRGAFIEAVAAAVTAVEEAAAVAACKQQAARSSNIMH